MAVASEVSQGLFLSAEQLRPGIFVMLDLSWLSHGFTRSSFKIRGEDHLRELRALKLARYRYDPQRSDPLALAELAANMAALAAAAAQPALPQQAAPESALERARAQRVLALAQRREKIEKVERAFGKASSVVKNLNRNVFSRPKETLEEMGSLVDQMVEAFLENPDATLHLMVDKAGGEDVYFHSLNVTILSMMLAKDMGLDAPSARDLGMGAMLHDIGLVEIPDRVRLKPPEDYNQAERSLRQQHVDYGSNIGLKLKLAPGVMAVIAQHHEFADGSGYPKGLRGAQLSPAASLVSLVNYYDNLCNPVDVKKAITPHEALSFMFAQKRSKFDVKALQLMIRSLGVYPPGSVVYLSNNALGMVTAMNPQKPLRPWVMLYDPTVPSSEAPLLDLALETELNITKAVSPALLPSKVVEYLNPRKRVTYFFDAAESAKSSQTKGAT